MLVIYKVSEAEAQHVAERCTWRGGQGPDHHTPSRHLKDFGSYPKGNEKPLEFERGDLARIQFTPKENHPCCCVESGRLGRSKSEGQETS